MIRVYISILVCAAAFGQDGAPKINPAGAASKSQVGGGFVGYVETVKPISALSFREPPKEDGAPGELILVDVSPEGTFVSEKPMPPKFVVDTIPPCVAVKNLVAADRDLVYGGTEVSGTGVRTKTQTLTVTKSDLTARFGTMDQFRGIKVSGEFAKLLRPLVGGKFDLEIGGINLGCSGAERRALPGTAGGADQPQRSGRLK